jgi:hypothetical protein
MIERPITGFYCPTSCTLVMLVGCVLQQSPSVLMSVQSAVGVAEFKVHSDKSWQCPALRICHVLGTSRSLSY